MYKKVAHYPRPHDFSYSFQLSTFDANKNSTHVPILYNDDDMSPASGYYANPRHGTFSETDSSACYPESRVNSVSVSLSFDLTKHGWSTDKIRNLTVNVIPVAMAFEDDYTAKDDYSDTEVEDLLYMSHSTDFHEAYPTYNGTDLSGDDTTLHSTQRGLTTDTKLEGLIPTGTITVENWLNNIYDAMKYSTNGGKLKSCIGQIITRTVNAGMAPTTGGLSTQTNVVKLRFNLPKKCKAINPYTYFGIIIAVPELGTAGQFGIGSDDSTGDQLHCGIRVRYNEWSDFYNMEPDLTAL